MATPKFFLPLDVDVTNALTGAITLLQDNLQKQLNRAYYPRSYDGVVKPVSGGDFGSLTKKSWRGNLSNSIKVKVVLNNQYINPSDPSSVEMAIRKGLFSLNIDFGDNKYWYYVNYGRKPGVPYEKKKQGRSKKTGRFQKNRYYTSYTKMPPLKDIQVWVETRPALVSNELSVETRTYLAMRSIARDGIYGINFIEKAMAETKLDIETYMGQAVSDWFVRLWYREQGVISRYIQGAINNPTTRR